MYTSGPLSFLTPILLFFFEILYLCHSGDNEGALSNNVLDVIFLIIVFKFNYMGIYLPFQPVHHFRAPWLNFSAEVECLLAGHFCIFDLDMTFTLTFNFIL